MFRLGSRTATLEHSCATSLVLDKELRRTISEVLRHALSPLDHHLNFAFNIRFRCILMWNLSRLSIRQSRSLNPYSVKAANQSHHHHPAATLRARNYSSMPPQNVDTSIHHETTGLAAKLASQHSEPASSGLTLYSGWFCPFVSLCLKSSSRTYHA